MMSRKAKLYDELMREVKSRWEGETRHQTALRYIREREERDEAIRERLAEYDKSAMPPDIPKEELN